MRSRLESILIGALSLLTMTVLAEPEPETITTKGSDTLVILAQKWAEIYMKANSSINVEISGGGSGTGFAALQNRTTDLATASRKMKPREIAACVKTFRKRPTEYKVCLDGVTIYVNNQNPISELTLDQLSDIFRGKTTNWKSLGGPDAPINLYSREGSSGTYEFFKKNVLSGKDFAAATQTMPGTAAVLQAVLKDINGIGYGGAAYGIGGKSIRLKYKQHSRAIQASEENILSHQYPLWRYLYIYVNPSLDRDAVSNYIHWIRGDEGQSIVRNVGYFPLPRELRSDLHSK
jgi:phosphate transport system substrate-binding protein